MPGALARIFIVRPDNDRPPRFADWARSLSPVVAPLLIFLCDLAQPRWELLVGALGWVVIILPGILAGNLLFSAHHPFNGIAARPAVTSVLGLLPFGILTWIGCLLHLRLTQVLIAYAVLYVAITILFSFALLRRSASSGAAETVEDDAQQASGPIISAGGFAVIAIVGLLLMLVGVVVASPLSQGGSTSEMIFKNAATAPSAWPWWVGSIVGASGAVIAAIAILFAYRKPVEAAGSDEKAAQKSKSKKGKGRREEASPKSFDLSGIFPGAIWAVVIVLTAYLMLVTYRLPPAGENRYPYDVDDVTYISEAVDYRYDLPMGRYESSYGSDVSMTRATMSPLYSPLIATISRLTGIACAALQHGVYPPLMILLGISALAAGLGVVCDRHRWAVPIGLVVALIFLLKSWSHSYTWVEMVLHRATATKSVHLLLIHPLQLATLLLVVQRQNKASIGGGLAVAIVGHLIHPFSTILGTVWTGVVLTFAAVTRRRAVAGVAIILFVYLTLGGICYWAKHRPLEKRPSGSGRAKGSFIDSRGLQRLDELVATVEASAADNLDKGLSPDLVQNLRQQGVNVSNRTPVKTVKPGAEWVLGDLLRGYRAVKGDDGLKVYQMNAKPILKHDLRWALGNNILFHAGVLAIPFVLAAGLRRRNVLIVGIIGGVVFVICNSTLLGGLLNKALPEPTMWRTRWMLPSLINLGIVAWVLFESLIAIVARGRSVRSSGLSLGAGVVTVAIFALAAYANSAPFAKMGKPPTTLTKFDVNMHQLVDLLGGVTADPFVWGPEHLVTRELPQLMPNVRLVMSRDKLMRAADHEDFRRIVRVTESLYRYGRMSRAHFEQLLRLYPEIDHVVADYGRRALDRNNRPTGKRAGEVQAAVLSNMGWQRVGRTEGGRYEVWRRDGSQP